MGAKKGSKRERDRHRELAMEQAGMSVVKHTPEAAIEEAEKRVLDWQFETDSSHDVPMTVGKVRARLVIDVETMWDEPPYQSKEQVLETVRSFVLKSLASHKYLQFVGIVTRMEVIDD